MADYIARDRPGHDEHALHRLRPRRPHPSPSTSASTSRSTPRAGWVEHDANEIWRRTREVIGGALAQRRLSRPATSPRSASPTSARRPSSGTARPASRSTTRSSGRTRAPTALVPRARRRRGASTASATASGCRCRPTSPARRSAGSSTTSPALRERAENGELALRHHRHLGALEPDRRPRRRRARDRRDQREPHAAHGPARRSTGTSRASS